MDRIEHLKQVIDNFRNDETLVREKIKDKENRFFFIPGLKGSNEMFALYSMYIDQDFTKARQFFFKAARIMEYSVNNYDRRYSDTGIYSMADALLSDEPNLIKRYCSFPNNNYNENSLGFQIMNATQNTIMNRWNELDKNIKFMERFLKQKKNQSFKGILDLYIGLSEQNADTITVGLKQILADRKKRKYYLDVYNKFMSLDTSAYCKLAWIKGYEIDLQSTFVPIELMIVKPLEVYSDYEFLKDKA